MVIDARRTNRRFISPRAVDLCTSETFARIEVEVPVCESSKDAQSLAEQISMWIGLADISDCFHRLGISEDLSKFFCLEPVRASDFNISVCEGELLVESDLVWPCLSALPMGFNWSMYWAQSCGEHLLAKVPTLGADRIVNDKSPAMVF